MSHQDPLPDVEPVVVPDLDLLLKRLQGAAIDARMVFHLDALNGLLDKQDRSLRVVTSEEPPYWAGLED